MILKPGYNTGALEHWSWKELLDLYGPEFEFMSKKSGTKKVENLKTIVSNSVVYKEHVPYNK